jgi:transcription elongation factor GreA
MDKFPMTVEGEEALRAELTELKTVVRPRIVNDIAVAREHGDLKENAEYHAAREQQSFAEGRIQELEVKLGSAQVIDVKAMPNTGKVIFGTTVDVIDLDTDEEVSYRIVGEDQADISQGMISYTSPVARAFIGKEEGDTTTVKAPAGDREYEILAVHYK